MHQAPLIILGTGMAGYATARLLRARDRERPLLLISRDGGEAYAKPMLSKALSEGKTVEQLVQATAGRQAELLRAEILTHTRVERLDPQAHSLTLEDGRTLDYSQLVLATGARPIRLPVDGDGADDILQINWLDDYRRYRQALKGRRRVLIIGPGLIGMEFASDLKQAGYQPLVVGPDTTPLGRLVPETVGRVLERRFSQAGIELELETVVQQVERDGNGYSITLANGKTVQADLVVMAVGLAPDIELARAAGLETDRGVRVDAHLQTSDPDIYALGDVAQYPQGWMPYVAPITAGARALAATLSGTPTPMALGPTPVQVKTGVFPLWLLNPPQGSRGEWVLNETDQGLQARFETEKGLAGWVLGGDAVSLRNEWLQQLVPGA